MKRITVLLGLGLVILLGSAWLAAASPAASSPVAQEATPNPNLSIGDDYCLGCHGTPGQTYTLEDGSTLDLYVNPQDHASSVHGAAGYACVQCHADVGEYPHPPFTARDARDATLQLNQVCQRCHASQYDLAMDSVHASAQQADNREAAVCTDCHTAHTVQDWVDETTGKTLPQARTRIPQVCAQCHNAIYQEYLTSVHGSALTEENNPDVPTCTDCHGVHNIQDPTTAAFRLSSPRICAKCHTDPAVMTKYGINTNVLNTYVADFHGTTVAIFEQQSPEEQLNMPVCYDCHGVHNIKRADDPEKGLQVKENLLATCQKCHPNAQDNFPTAWLSHYIPSPEKYPIVYYINLFYKFFIPTVLGGMGLLVVLDVSRRTINRRKETLPVQVAVEPPPTGQPETVLLSAADDVILSAADAVIPSAADDVILSAAKDLDSSVAALPQNDTGGEVEDVDPGEISPGDNQKPGKEASDD